MSLFQTAKNEMAYLKCGVQGFSGSGKTFSSSLIAIGLWNHIKSAKPVFILDTETGSDYVLKHFKKAGVGLMTSKTRAFVDLLKAVHEAEESSDILIIDSITHFWNDLVDSCAKKKDKKRLTLKDWAEIKPEWRQFTELYLKSRLHIIMCGRSGWDFDYQEDDEGVKELQKTGTKMLTEAQTRFEPSLNLEMEQVRAQTGRIGSHFDYRMWVLKDRFNVINGRTCTFPPAPDDKIIYDANPVFKFLLPHIEALNLGGEHKTIEGGDSTGLFNTRDSAAFAMRQKDIALEEIKDQITLLYPGRDAESNRLKLTLLKDTFGTSSWTAIESMSLDVVSKARDKINGMTAVEKTAVGNDGKGESK